MGKKRCETKLAACIFQEFEDGKPDGTFTIWIPDGEATEALPEIITEKYADEGSSVRGTEEDVLKEAAEALRALRKELTYEELIALAKEHYAEGGDATVECVDEQWFDTYVRMFGPMTERKALEMFRIDKARYDDIKATVW